MYTCDKPDAIMEQQVGSLWQGEHILSVSLTGAINYWDRKSARPSRVIVGHQKAITAMDVDDAGCLYTASYDGRVCAWQEEGIASKIQGSGHSNQVTGITAAAKGGVIYTSGMDDTIRTITDKKFT